MPEPRFESHSELPPPPKRLQRSADNKLLLGVCGGLADYFDADPTLVRVAFVLVALLAGTGALLYVALALIMPNPAMADAHPRDAARSTLDEAQAELRRGWERLKEAVGVGKR
jgi:phage shock protein PspC (stress-responsive transcriptional regulator)